MSVFGLLDPLLVVFFRLLPRRLTGISVLMYHSVSDADTLLAVRPGKFERQMRYIHEHGFGTVFASEVPALLTSGDVRNCVCVTFDDGYQDTYTTAFPILKRYGIKATVFLTTGTMGGVFNTSDGHTFSLLAEKEISDMVQSGLVEFMPHSHTHPQFPQITAERMREELQTSRLIVEKMSGRPANVFAYPKGKVNGEVVAALREQKFTAAFGVQPGLVRAGADPYRLPRNAVFPTHDLLAFKLKLSDSLEQYLVFKALLKNI